ncbi:Lsr2 dimerization domain-containing protein [Nonomuraea lactucae]|uniref:Lsr2 family DNA-binding protein n=1 Tax=Nonomuraea lactucae TaxID=2249762 RepID=UPI000DE1BCF6|nr:histone-like nucleoid-structuring protein Lsr2 [Nonomuraea lactucae]
MPIRIVELFLCDYCAKEDKETEAPHKIEINGKRALACDTHAKPILKALETFEAVAERIPTETARPARSGRTRAARGGSGAAPQGDAPTTNEVRQWAQANNIPVSAKARVASDVWEKFYEAFPDRRPAS